MDIDKAIRKVKQKISNIIIKNEENFTFTNINILILKALINNIHNLETEDEKKILTIKKINNYLKTTIINDFTIYTNKNELTKLSIESILNIYKELGIKNCLNDSVIRQYYKENKLNYNLFFNQVDYENEIIVDYFKLFENNDFLIEETNASRLTKIEKMIENDIAKIKKTIIEKVDKVNGLVLHTIENFDIKFYNPYGIR